MAEYVLKGQSVVLSATGPAGPPLRREYCKPRCYDAEEPNGACTCMVCHGYAHGRGWNYASEHGYLECSIPGSQRSPEGQQWLPFPDGQALQFGTPIELKTGLTGSGAA